MQTIKPELKQRLEAFEQSLSAELGIPVKVEFPQRKCEELPPEYELPHDNPEHG